MSYLLKKLSSKQEIDDVIRSTEDLVLVLRFGRDSDLTCMQLDEIVSCCILRPPVSLTADRTVWTTTARTLLLRPHTYQVPHIDLPIED